MRIRLIAGILTLVGAAPAHAAIQIVYGDNPQDELNTENVVELRNVYEDTIAELEVVRQKREASLREEQERREASLREEKDQELQREREEHERRLEEERARLEQAERELEAFRQQQREAEAREARERHMKEEYNLAVDHTVKVVNHQGTMPDALPPIASEGFDAPLLAAFNAVVPMDWQVYVHQDIDDQREVTWQTEDQNWVATMYQIGVRYDYSYDINWDEQWVLVNRSDLRLGLSESDRPIIEVMGHEVEPGTEGYMLINNQIIRVRSTDR